jgi:acylphosphatase
MMKPAESLELIVAQVVVSGRVQGVCYRAFTQEAALGLGLRGWVRNLPNGDVQAEIEGSRDKVAELLVQLRIGPSRARVTDLNVLWKPAAGHVGFVILD